MTSTPLQFAPSQTPERRQSSSAASPAVPTPQAEPELHPFDLERAMAGDPVCDRRGRRVRFIAHVPDAVERMERVVVRDADGDVILLNESGRFMRNGEESYMDLFMVTLREPSFAECKAFCEAALGAHAESLTCASHIALAAYAIKHGALAGSAVSL